MWRKAFFGAVWLTIWAGTAYLMFIYLKLPM